MSTFPTTFNPLYQPGTLPRGRRGLLPRRIVPSFLSITSDDRYRRCGVQKRRKVKWKINLFRQGISCVRLPVSLYNGGGRRKGRVVYKVACLMTVLRPFSHLVQCLCLGRHSQTTRALGADGPNNFRTLHSPSGCTPTY